MKEKDIKKIIETYIELDEGKLTVPIHNISDNEYIEFIKNVQLLTYKSLRGEND